MKQRRQMCSLQMLQWVPELSWSKQPRPAPNPLPKRGKAGAVVLSTHRLSGIFKGKGFCQNALQLGFEGTNTRKQNSPSQVHGQMW